MAFGFPAHHSEEYAPDDFGGELRPLAEKALAALFWPVRQQHGDVILAATNMNLRASWDKIALEFRPDGCVKVTSTCRRATQCFDWGRNEKNVRLFLTELEKQVAPRELAVASPVREENPMAFGFPARHTEILSPPPGDHDLRDVVRETLHELEWPLRQELTDALLAATSMNLRSWGEKIVVELPPDGSLKVTSKCAMPTQCLDWGRNKANVARFVATLRERLGGDDARQA